MKNNDNIQRLIITDNKTMAVTIAKYFGYTEDDEAVTYYDGTTDEILWTGGNLLTLELNDKTVAIKDLDNMSAEEIAKNCYKAVPRSHRGTISHLDALRLEYIENAMSYSDEIVFVCQPTDESERLIQAIKLFFDIKLPMRTIVCKEFHSIGIDEGIERDIRSQRVIRHLSAKAMKDNVVNDLLRSEMEEVEGKEVSPQSMLLLSEIAKRIEVLGKGGHNPDLPRKARMSRIVDLELLYCVMTTKYAMPMDAMWQSLVYLYAKGYINNPMTHCISKLDDSEYFGDGNPGYVKPLHTYRRCVSHCGGIYPLEDTGYELLSINYNPDEAPDDFMGRTSAIYTYIVEEMERMENQAEPIIKTFPSFKEGHGITIFEALRFAYREAFPTHSNSIRDSFGSLMDELEYTGLIIIKDGYVTMTSFGYQALTDNGYA